MKTYIVSDAVLVSNYIKGNTEDINVLIERYKDRLYNFIYSKLHDKIVAEDLLQDTFVKVIVKLKTHNYHEEGKFLPWVFRIAHNLVMDYFRINKRLPKFKNSKDFDIFSVISDSSLNIEKRLVNYQITTDVKRLLEELPEDQKQVVVMRLYQNLSFKDIAEETGVSINTALGRMRYGVINIRKVIKKHQINLEYNCS